MRTTIEIDDDLMRRASEAAPGLSKKAVVEVALDEFVRAKARERLVKRIRSGDLGIDLTIEELRKMRGCE